MALTAYVDATAAVCTWINRQRDTLVGRGRPLAAGAHRDPQKSPASGAVAWVSTPSTTGDDSEAPISYALVSCAVYGMTDANAYRGAVALANAFHDLDGAPAAAGDAVLLAVEQITGPNRLPDGVQHRYIVDALISLTPA